MVSVPTLAKRVLQASAAAVGSYVLALRPWHQTWGATEEEVEAGMPGDEVIDKPAFQTTRAVTVVAPVDQVWERLVQAVAALRDPDGSTPSSGLRQGEIVPIDPDNPDEGVQVAQLSPGQSLVLHGTWVPGRPMRDYPVELDERIDAWIDLTWALTVEPLDDHMTRVVGRVRADAKGVKMHTVLRTLVEPAQFVLERKLLKRLKGAPDEVQAGEDEEVQASQPPEPVIEDGDRAQARESVLDPPG